MHVGTQAISYIHSKGGSPSMASITHSSHMDIFQNLAVDLDTEGIVTSQCVRLQACLLFINAVVQYCGGCCPGQAPIRGRPSWYFVSGALKGPV